MTQKFNSDNKLLQQIEKHRQNILDKLINNDEHVSAAMVETIRRLDRMIYNIIMTGESIDE